MIHDPRHPLGLMPPLAPLAMLEQSFRAPSPAMHTPPPARSGALPWRLGAFGPAAAIGLALIVGLSWWLWRGGATPGEGVVVVFLGLSLAWFTLSVSAVVLALAYRARRRAGPRPRRDRRLDVALLIPIHNEPTADVAGNIAAMRAELARLVAARGGHRYAFFILSDTQDPAIAAAEARALVDMQSASDAAGGAIAVHYRRRAVNTDRKIGNLHDWIANWGGAWEAMIVLDADSLMSGAAIGQLSDAMAQDPDAGLIQSFPVLIGAETLFGRMQEFATSVYGWLAAEGLALWSRTEGNYWGHNAIIRIRAFAESARLPHLHSRSGAPQLILSHDFVEAGLLRRSGWSVRFLPQRGGSYEETPATLVDFVLRDQRWCRGNMQHLRLLAARGFHPISRFHLFQGAMAYLLSPAWFAFLVIWAAILPVAGPPDSYFNPEAPLYPVWPVWSQLSRVGGSWLLIAVLAMLLFPKIVAAGLMLRRHRLRRLYGGAAVFVATTLVEIVLSVLYAPILMVQQTKAVLRALTGSPQTWAPQHRGAVRHGWPTLLRFHWLEVVLGVALVCGIAAGLLSAWLSLVTASLVAAPVLSRLSGLRVSGRRLGPLRLETPCSLRLPRVARAAQAERARLRALLAADTAPPAAIAAE